MHSARLFVTAIAVAIGIALFLGPTNVAHAATFTVDSTADDGDFDTGDGVCDTDDSAGDGPCTLRAAIEQANATGGTDTINFSITGSGPHTISPSSPLPAVTDPAIIDGTSEPDFAGSPVVEIDGSGAGVNAIGLDIEAGSSSMKGLSIHSFAGFAILLGFPGDNNVVEGNYIGTIPPGSVDLGNGTGIAIESDGHVISGNLIAYNDNFGIWGLGFSSATISDNVIRDNDADGIMAIGASDASLDIRTNSIHSNGDLGIDLNNDGPTPDDIGDTDTGPNGLQNSGTLYALMNRGSSFVISGAGKGGPPNTTFDVDLFHSDACDPSGFGEGQFYVGSGSATSDSSGEAKVTLSVPTILPTGNFATVTTTDPNGNTSEFSNCIEIVDDSDLDGVQDEIDVGAGGFNDVALGGVTTGSIVDTGGLYAFVTDEQPDAADPNQGVIIGAVGVGGPATVDACGDANPVFPGGAILRIDCNGSARIDVITGPTDVLIGTMTGTLETGDMVTVEDNGDGTFTVENRGTEDVEFGGTTVGGGQTDTLQDTDGDGLEDAADLCPLASWITPVGDDDCDGFITADENYFGTDPNDDCPDNTGDDAWGPDFDNSTVVDIDDVLSFVPVILEPPGASPNALRHDLIPSEFVDIGDVLVLANFILEDCDG